MFVVALLLIFMSSAIETSVSEFGSHFEFVKEVEKTDRGMAQTLKDNFPFYHQVAFVLEYSIVSQKILNALTVIMLMIGMAFFMQNIRRNKRKEDKKENE